VYGMVPSGFTLWSDERKDAHTSGKAGADWCERNASVEPREWQQSHHPGRAHREKHGRQSFREAPLGRTVDLPKTYNFSCF
jgi:hypothetical protein